MQMGFWFNLRQISSAFLIVLKKKEFNFMIYFEHTKYGILRWFEIDSQLRPIVIFYNFCLY